MKFSINQFKEKYKSVLDQHEFNEDQLLQSELNLKKRCSECAISICNDKTICTNCEIKNIIFNSYFSRTLYNRIREAESMIDEKSFLGSVKDKINISRKLSKRNKTIVKLIEEINIPSNKTDILGFIFLSEYEIKKYSEKEIAANLKSEIHGFSEIKKAFLKKRKSLIEKVKREYSDDIKLMLAIGDNKIAKKLKKKISKDKNETTIVSTDSKAQHIKYEELDSDYSTHQNIEPYLTDTLHSNPSIKNSNPTIKNSNPSIKNSNPTIKNTNPTIKNSNPSIKNTNPSIKNSNPSIKNTNPSIKNTNPSIKNTNPSIKNTNPSIKNTNPSIKNTNPPIKNTNPPKKKYADSKKGISNKVTIFIIAVTVVTLIAIFASIIINHVKNTRDDISDNSIKYSISAVIESEKNRINEEKQASSTNDYNKESRANYETKHKEAAGRNESQGEMVWITENGDCYHSKPDCGNSRYSFQVPKSQVINKLKRCTKCWKK